MQRARAPQSGSGDWDAKLTRVVREVFRTTPRGVVEFLVVVAVFLTCDPTLPSLGLGAAVSAAGVTARLAAAGYGYNVGELSLRGPYRLVRHPYFLGSALLFLGLCLAGGNAYALAGAAVALTLVYRRSYRQDEARLALRLGPRFDAYLATVPAFIPQLLPVAAPADDGPGFSLERALLRGRHREVDALVGLGVAYGLLYAAYWTSAKDLYRLGLAAAVGLYLVGRFIYYGAARRPKPTNLQGA